MNNGAIRKAIFDTLQKMNDEIFEKVQSNEMDKEQLDELLHDHTIIVSALYRELYRLNNDKKTA